MHADLTLTDILFGCWHKRLSFPFTPRAGQSRPVAALQTGTYVVCLKCGKQFPYDWNQMRIVPGSAGVGYAHTRVEAKSHI